MSKNDPHILGKESIGKLLLQYSIPAIIGMTITSIYNIIDSIFIGHGVGSDGVAAVNIVSPMYQFFSGVGLMIGIGCSVVVSIFMAQRKIKVARLNVTQALAFSSFLTFMVCVLAMLYPEQAARLLGSSETLLPLTSDYLFWLVPSLVFEMWSFIGLFIIRLDGAPKVAMWCNIISAAMNVLLDWVMIFPLGMGIKGAAIATSASIMLGGFISLGYLLFYARTLRPASLKLSRRSLALSFRNVGYHCRVGLPTLLGEMTLAVLIFMGNLMFMKYLGDDGVAAFGVACYYTPFFFNIGNAVAQSAQPIISYNYGVSRWGNVAQARRLLFVSASGFGILAMLLFLFFPHVLVSLFLDPAAVAAQMAREGFPYYAVGVPFFILNVAVIGYCQSVERMKAATALVFLRGLGLLVPAFLLLPGWLGVKGIWLSMPFTEITTLLLIFLWQYRMNRIIAQKPERKMGY